MIVIQNIYLRKNILKHRKANNLIKTWANDLSTHLPEEPRQTGKEQVKDAPCPMSSGHANENGTEKPLHVENGQRLERWRHQMLARM